MIGREQAEEIARKYGATAAYIERIAEFSAVLAAGVDQWEAARAIGVTARASVYRYARWERQLRSELAAARVEDTPNDEGDNEQ